MSVFAALFVAWLCVIGGVLLAFRRELLAVWREPVLRVPVMIIESDDWGAGPVAPQAAALDRLADALARHHDSRGCHPVMTLALVLAVPDGQAIAAQGAYRPLTLSDPVFNPIRQAIERGRARGVFALQLHGLEHYWPESLIASADPTVKAWLLAKAPGRTEALPSPLQSRWVDATVLPSRPLAADAIAQAVEAETRLYREVFGTQPAVVVPPTFVWADAVERAWAAAGVAFVVTPGLRSACRNAEGLPDCDHGPLFNGQLGQGVHYLVRDDYFEPERGHRAEDALAALARKWEARRPCLLETHRSNFVGDEDAAGRHLAEVDRLYALALARHPDLHFISTEELGRAFRDGNAAWIEDSGSVRLVAWLLRVRALRSFWKAARLTGLAWPMNLIKMTLS